MNTSSPLPSSLPPAALPWVQSPARLLPPAARTLREARGGGASETRHEWLEADGLGGFASGTMDGVRSRRYHALLLTATQPPAGRMVLVNGFDAWVETRAGRFLLSSQDYAPGVRGGDGAQRIEAAGGSPWPHWIYRLEDGTRIEFELFVPKGEPMTCLSWKLLGVRRDVKLFVRPFLSGRDYHSLHKSNPAFRFESDVKPDRVCWQPYAGVPGIAALTNGSYTQDPQWYYNFHYAEEQARGLDAEEDLAAPGIFSWDLGAAKAALVLTTRTHADSTLPASVRPAELLNERRAREQARRSRFASPLHAAADAYVVQRGKGQTLIAGYPWFTDWGRDTFIALRGCCLATGRLEVARDILVAWSGAVSEGMLPNRFPDHGETPEFNAVDASLWFIVAAHEYMERDRAAGRPDLAVHRQLGQAMLAILEGYQAGTRYGIGMDRDGLLAAGQPGAQLTWMDAKVGEWVVTPRAGKPVEVQALWVNALHIGAALDDRWQPWFDRSLRSFRERFWNDARRCLYDVVDANHRAGEVDATIRPNQILAIGGLPLALLEGERARLVVERVEDELFTPLGLRTLAPSEPGYRPHYEGGVVERDGAYHQGTAWPWLLGPFVEAWVRVRGSTPEARREARRRFLDPLLQQCAQAGHGHLPEIADGDSPHAPRGCPFQAWSVGEALRLDQVVLADPDRAARPGSAGSSEKSPRAKSGSRPTSALAAGKEPRR